MPDLKELAAREQALREEQRKTMQLGTKQLLSIGQQLGSRRVLTPFTRLLLILLSSDMLIQEAVKKTKDLASKMGVLASSAPAGSFEEE